MAGLFGDWSDPDATEVVSETAPTPSPIGIWKIAIGVFLGNVLTGLVGGLLYSLFH
jgi:hypothetical protein